MCAVRQDSGAVSALRSSALSCLDMHLVTHCTCRTVRAVQGYMPHHLGPGTCSAF